MVNNSLDVSFTAAVVAVGAVAAAAAAFVVLFG